VAGWLAAAAALGRRLGWLAWQLLEVGV